MRQLAQWTAAGEEEEAFWLRQIAEQPVATWFADPGEDPEPRAERLTSAARAAGETAVLVAYAVPGRDCALHSAGGSPTYEAYAAWIRRLAEGVRGRGALVVLEPDAVAHAVEGCDSLPGQDPAARYAALRDAVEVLGADPSTRVYLDAGNAGWIDDLDVLAQALRDAGIKQADGFALNVSNFKTDESSTSYGRALSARTGGAHFVVDTSRNGAGPADPDGSGTEWCNPPGRQLGRTPTLETGDALVDAYLWVKQPGDSDGPCRPGEPAAGAWWPEYALDLVMSTRMGHTWTSHP